MRPYVAALGHVTADEYYQCVQDIVPGDKFFVRYLETCAGGMVANAACVLGALGTDTKFISALGQDRHTDFLLRSFQGGTVDISHVEILPQYKNFTTAILLNTQSTDRTIMLYSVEKPVAVLNQETEDLLAQATYIYGLMSDFRSLPDYETRLECWNRTGAKLMLDVECSTFTSKDNPEDALFFQAAHVLSFNQEAVKQYCGNDQEDAIDQLVANTDKIVLITRGSRGSTVVTRQGRVDVPCYPAQVVDTTGAGDTFNSAFLHGLLQNWDLTFCAQFASAAAHFCVESYGSRGGLMSQAGILNFLQGKHLHLTLPSNES